MHNLKLFLGSTLLLLLLILPRFAEAEEKGFVILPGDVLHITVWKEEGMDHEVLVLPDGTITFPLIGTLKVHNMTPSEMQAAIRKKLHSAIPEAAVTVSVQAPLGHKVSVIGQVQEPGEIILNTRMGVMQVLSKVGGLTPYADKNEIIIIRETAEGEKEKIDFPYKAISKGRELDKDIDLLPGDVLVIPASGLF